MTKAEMFSRMLEVEQAAQALLTAMDRQYGGSPFSQNVTQARAHLKTLFPIPRDLADKADRAA